MRLFSRRETLKLGLAAGLATASSRSWAQIAPQTVTVALDWSPNTNHIGLYAARDKGFYAEAGLQVDILPYGDTSSGTLVSNGIAHFGVSGSLGFFTQRTAGADLKAVYAVVQTETGRLVFNADRADIQSPKDLDGLTYGGFGSDWEKALIGTLIRNDGGKGVFETVTLGTSAYDALANGAVDFTLEVYTWEGVKAEIEGRGQRAFRYADFGVPDQHTTFIVSSEAYLSANPDTASAFIQATRHGYRFAVENHGEAAELLIAAHPDIFTDPALIHASLRALVAGNYLRGADGIIGSIEPAKVEAIGEFLFAAGILRDADGRPVAARPDFSAFYTNRYLGGG
jgi:ABC-type nitrate/sulfonate/bicarbonate transport system substrate-binding protein